MHDFVIKNARIYDGAGTPAFPGDLAVKNGRISQIARHIDAACPIVDAAGLALSPGFIDPHSHSDGVLESWPSSYYKLEQGITTEVTGSCGASRAPVSRQFPDTSLRILASGGGDINPDDYSTFAAYMRRMNISFGPNIAMQVGHSTLRAAVSGIADRPLTPGEMDAMRAHVEEAMQAGAMGVSFGLIYPPGSYGDERELTELVKIVARYGGTFTIHMRNESSGLLESVAEVIRMSETTGCRAVISHHKASGKRNHGLTARSLELVDSAVARGCDIYLDQYPYTASSTGMDTMIPGGLHTMGTDRLVRMMSEPSGRAELRSAIEKDRGVEAGGDLAATMDYVMVATSDSHPGYSGRMLLDIAREKDMDICELLFDTLRDDRLSTGAIFFSMCEEDVERVMKYPRVMIGTDGLFTGDEFAHPRAFGTFPRFLGRYVRDRGIMPLEEAIRRITSMPAGVFGFQSKGLLREGMDADLTLFDPEVIIDNADYVSYNAKCTGLAAVYVDGREAVRDAVWNGKMFGRLLSR